MNSDLILLADPDKDIFTALLQPLTQFGYDVRFVERGEDAWMFCMDNRPNLVVLEAELPDMSGFELCRRLQTERKTARIPLLFYTARDEEMDLVVGFQLGATDYVSKTVGVRELSLRIAAVLKRRRPDKKKKVLRLGNIVIDFEQSIAIHHDKRLSLSPTEFQILGFLARAEGRVLRRREIISQVWRGDTSVMTRTVDAYVKALRAKLSDKGINITTIRGLGYSLRMTDYGKQIESGD